MKNKQTKYVFITGGVVSSLGKGIVSASLGALLESRNINIGMLKLDPYLNVDPGTMSPIQHGEVFVTEDGTETDLDLGHYERYTSKILSKINSVTAGQIYQEVLKKERTGAYLGATVQVIPHITNEVKAFIRNAAKNHEILLCEIGGTIGDIESLPFIESIRQIKSEEKAENTLFIHLSYVPEISPTKELKTKPTQHSVKNLLSLGIQPEILILRANTDISREIKNKISLFCNVKEESVISCPDAETIYEVPLTLNKEKLDQLVVNYLKIKTTKPKLSKWEKIVTNFKRSKAVVKIGIIGKYVKSTESYKSINEALIHSGIKRKVKIEFIYIDAEEIINNNAEKHLAQLNGIIVPGGFGERGIDGKISAIKFARQSKIPFLGICLGLQIAVVEFARNVANIKNANSQEFDSDNENNVIHIMEAQKEVTEKGGTMRLGNYACVLKEPSLAKKIYKKEIIIERHRHRYEVNKKFKAQLTDSGLIFSGESRNGSLLEIIELSDHPFFIACQFHPEFLSKPFKPHPLFSAFLAASVKKKK